MNFMMEEKKRRNLKTFHGSQEALTVQVTEWGGVEVVTEPHPLLFRIDSKRPTIVDTRSWNWNLILMTGALQPAKGDQRREEVVVAMVQV
jgi:hypothetical protein